MSTASAFHEAFQAFHVSATTRLANFTNDSDIDLLDPLSDMITSQQRHLNEAADALPSYDIRRYQSALDQLFETISSLKEKQAPKPKFSFKSKRSTRDVAKSTETPVLEILEKVSETRSDPVDHTAPDVSGSLTITQEIQESKDINLVTYPAILKSSVITIHSVSSRIINLNRVEPYTSVTLRGLSSCTIFVGSCSSSLFIEACSSCKIQGSAQQFRIHSSRDCEIRYTCLTGRPIIEDCHDMQFFNEAKDESGLAMQTIIDDFSNLSGTRRNWSILAS